MITFRNIWETLSEQERDYPAMICDGLFAPSLVIGAQPVRSQTIIKDYVDGKQTHPAVLVLSDLRPEEVK